jgi:hypothetical protein
MITAGREIGIGNQSMDKLRIFAALVLLSAYLIGNIQFEVLHEALHQHDEAVSHSLEAEQDACHRSIYHDDADNGCVHPTHLTSAETCPLSDVIVLSDQLFIAESTCVFVGKVSFHVEKLQPVELVDIGASLPSRAPPLV